MAAIPRSTLLGHRLLHERAEHALDLCQEAEDVDFKESADWETLKWRITHTALGMGNLRDGGLIVIGVGERDTEWQLDGIQVEHLATYDPDHIAAHLNAYGSPHIDIDAVIVTHHGAKDFLVIQVREFRETPLVCKKNGPNKSPLMEGRVFIRLPGPPRTSVITDAAQMHTLLELAAEKRARRLLEAGRRIGLVEARPATDRYDEELGGL